MVVAKTFGFFILMTIVIGCKSVSFKPMLALDLVSPVKLKTIKKGPMLALSESEYLHWGELTTSQGKQFQPIAGERFSFLTSVTSFEQGNERKPRVRFPRSIENDLELKRLVLTRYMKRARPYLWGALDKIGDSLIYVAKRKKVPNYSRLYRVIIRVLSKEYGCLMKKRDFLGKKMRLYCRDGRKVVVQSDNGRNWIQFVSYQLDRSGRRISVQNHKIVKTSLQRKYLN